MRSVYGPVSFSVINSSALVLWVIAPAPAQVTAVDVQNLVNKQKVGVTNYFLVFDCEVIFVMSFHAVADFPDEFCLVNQLLIKRRHFLERFFEM